jgi:hypothetical protein
MSTVRVKVEMRRRPDVHESRKDAHAAFMERSKSLDSQWWRATERPELVEDRSLEIQVNLNSELPSDATGYAAYVLRDSGYLGDSALYDDRCVLEFRVDERSFPSLALEGFPAYVQAFRPYRAQVVLDEDMALDDWDEAIARKAKSGRDEDGRDGVVRIWPVAFYDAELCRRSFALQPTEVVRRLSNAGYEAECILDGVLVRASAELLDSAGVRSVTESIKSALALDAPTSDPVDS